MEHCPDGAVRLWSAPHAIPLQDPERREWRDAMRQGRVRRLRRGPQGRLHPPLRPPHQVRETAARHFAGQEGLVLVGFAEDALAASQVGALARRRSLSACLWRDRHGGSPRRFTRCRWKTARTAFRRAAHEPRQPGLSPGAPAAACARCRDGAWADDPCAEDAACRQCRAAADPRLARRGLGPPLSQSAGACGGLRQECRGAGPDAGAGLRLHRDRHGHALAAGRKPAAAAVPPARRTKR